MGIMKMTNMEIEQLRIAVIGLGYVGFPLFATVFQ